MTLCRLANSLLSHSFEQSLFLPFWRSKISVNLMVEKADKRCVWVC